MHFPSAFDIKLMFRKLISEERDAAATAIIIVDFSVKSFSNNYLYGGKAYK